MMTLQRHNKQIPVRGQHRMYLTIAPGNPFFESQRSFADRDLFTNV